MTKKITMQNIFHDGGFSSMGMSRRAMDVYTKSLDEYYEFKDVMHKKEES